VNALRERQICNMLGTLLLSRGTPMVLAGDEFGRTQGGNNNAYCQDNEISWLNWEIEEKGERIVRFVQRVAAIRHKYPVLHRTRWLTAQWNQEIDVKDVAWLTPTGPEMTDENWSDANARCMGVLLDGRAQPTGMHRRGVDQSLLLILNSHHDVVSFELPEVVGGLRWRRLIDTNQLDSEDDPTFEFASSYEVTGRSLLLFELVMDRSYATARVERAT